MAADDDQLAAVFRVLEAAIGDQIVAMYQYGSAVHGGLRPASDLDVFVVVGEPLEDAQRVALVAGVGAVSGLPDDAGSGRPVEVTVARRASVVPWPDTPVREFQYGEWLRAEFEAGYLSPQVVDHDLAPLVTTVLTASVPIVGPPASDLLVPVPLTALVAAMKVEASQLIDELDSDTTNVLLTLCRMLFTAATGEVAPKDVAADWVLRELEPSAGDQLIRARDIYRDGSLAGSYDMVEVGALATDLADRIARLPPVGRTLEHLSEEQPSD
ncbi:MAG: aminoglycoside adenylyltransferase family protein [Actinomycetota bacterium]